MVVLKGIGVFKDISFGKILIVSPKEDGISKKTIDNYVHAIYRFLKYYENEDISSFDEDSIIEYVRHNYLKKSCAGNTYNMNISAIKFFYSINFKKEFNKKLFEITKMKNPIENSERRSR